MICETYDLFYQDVLSSNIRERAGLVEMVQIAVTMGMMVLAAPALAGMVPLVAIFERRQEGGGRVLVTCGVRSASDAWG